MSKKETCKNCTHCAPSYKGGVCKRDGKDKRVKYSGSCEKWEEKS